MNKVIVYSLFLFIISINSVQAQQTYSPINLRYKNGLRFGVNYFTLDAPDNVALHYQIHYVRFIKNEGFTINSTLGYLQAESDKDLLNPFRRKRLTADLTIAVSPIRNSHHAWRIGLGPSIWYRDDLVVSRSTYSVGLDGSIYNIKLEMNSVKTTDIGYHLMTEYEYKFNPRLSATARFALANLSRAGYSTILGAHLGYRF